VGNLGKLADGLPPFNHLEVVASGQDVLLKAGVDSGDFFRFSQNNSKFDITAVDKHKNGHVGLAGKVIVVDPGHGSYEARGKDYGAAGKSGVTEYDVVTPISMKLKAKLEANGAKVILTRGEAFKTISLSERAYVANNNNADAFVSIHADSFPSNTKVSGSKVFYYDGNARLTTQVQSEVRKALATAIADQIRPVSGRAQVNMANFAVNPRFAYERRVLSFVSLEDGSFGVAHFSSGTSVIIATRSLKNSGTSSPSDIRFFIN